MADPFQPKFADLVRNYSDTTGTGNLILGDPVAGFTSFAAALQPGDRFYYSVAGIQNASETEVGRGTLEADGSIAREPVNGVLTDFSAGKKSVALVAAAEWFNSVGSAGSTAIRPADFGAVGDGATDDLAALQAFNDFVFAAGRSDHADWTGNFAVSGQLFVGPAQPKGGDALWKLGGNLKLVQLSPTFETLRLRNLNQEHWFGSITVQGPGLIDFASRTCGVGIALENCGNMKISGGLIVDKFWYAGVITPVINNDGAMLGQVVATNCGSGSLATGATLRANYSGAVNSGVSGGPSQRTTLTVDVFPDPLVESYAPVGGQQLCVRIGDRFYFVYSWDRIAGTIDVFPWLDPAEASAGMLDWVFGGGLVTMTSDGNCIYVDKLSISNCSDRGHAVGRGSATCRSRRRPIAVPFLGCSGRCAPREASSGRRTFRNPARRRAQKVSRTS